MATNHLPGVARIAATALSVLIATGCQSRIEPRPYTAVGIEMQVIDEHEKNQEDHDFAESLSRLYYAGPQAVNELAQALESPKRSHRHLAGYALQAMTEHWKWPEAYAFLVRRSTGRIPQVEEAGALLYATAHEGARNYPELLILAAMYVDEGVHTVHTIRVNSPENKVDMRPCDYAAYVIQVIAGTSFGAGRCIRSDEAVLKARHWVRENMEHQENGKTVLRVPEGLVRDRMKQVAD